MKQIVNIPKEPLAADRKSIKDDEFVNYYIIELKYAREIDGKLYYEENRLQGLVDVIRRSGYALSVADMRSVEEVHGIHFKDLTDGKERLRMNTYTDEPMYRIAENGQYTFHPQFFKELGKRKMRLLRIQAPLEWHAERSPRNYSNERKFIDPDITVFWEPKWG